MIYSERIGKNPYPNIERFNTLWNERRITTPLVIMVGGYAGVGKSTLAYAVGKQVNNISFYATGFARAAAQTFIAPDENAALYKSTFSLHELTYGEVDERKIVELFKRQRDPVTKILVRSINFVAEEHQHTIIDGNHVSPDLSAEISRNNPGIIPIEVYLSVTDPETHRKMMEGPTHSRKISDVDFETARILHDFIVSEARENEKSVLEYSAGIRGTLVMIDKRLEEIV